MKATESVSKPDIVLTAPRPRRITLDLADIKPGSFTLRDAFDIARVTGADITKLGDALHSQGAEIMYAIAWVFLRRIEPDTTWDEVCLCDLTVVGSANPDDMRADAIEARTRMALSKVTGLPPDEVEQLTLAEIGALGG